MSAARMIPVPSLAPRKFGRRYNGFGALSAQDQTIAQGAASAAVLTGTLVAGPLGAAVAAAVSQIGILLANVFSGCGQTCTQASDLANQAEPLLQQNLASYLAEPVHYASLQAAYLNNFTLTWNALVAACGNPALQSAGQNCISDRQEGACHYQTSPGGWQQQNGTWVYVNPGAQGSGSTCWNWFVGYHDPIANDPTVVPDPAGALPSNLLSSIGISPTATLFGLPVVDVALAAGALLLLWMVL
jgi:hypothetical protein